MLKLSLEAAKLKDTVSTTISTVKGPGREPDWTDASGIVFMVNRGLASEL